MNSETTCNSLAAAIILALTFVSITGCGNKIEPKTPIADRFVELPAPTPADTDAAAQQVKDAIAQYWTTWKARIKADACKP